MNRRPIHPQEPPQAPRPIEVACPTPPEYRSVIKTKKPTKPNTSPVKRNLGLDGLILALVSILLSVTGIYLHRQGAGDRASATKAQFVLGRNIENDRLQGCGFDCILIGPYQIRHEGDIHVEQGSTYILPWYLELNQQGDPYILTARLPRNPPKTYQQPDNALELPNNLTPNATRVVNYDRYSGMVTFDNGKILQAKDPDDILKYQPGTHWIVAVNPREPKKIDYSFNLSSDRVVKTFYGYVRPDQDFFNPAPPLHEYPLPNAPLVGEPSPLPKSR